MIEKQYISRTEFDDYCNGTFTKVVASLPLAQKFSEKSLWFKEAAAMALGYADYDTLLLMWEREESIRQGVWAEWCATRNALSIKSMNIVAVYHPDLSQWFIASLRSGEEGRPLGTQSAESLECAVLECPQGAVFTSLKNAPNYLHECRDRDHADCIHLPFSYTENDVSRTGYLQVVRTYEGLILDVFDASGDESSDSVGVMFSDRSVAENDWLAVDLVDKKPLVNTFYRWMRPRTDEDRPILDYIDPDEEFSVSELRFDSEQDAINMVASEEWNVNPQSMSDNHAVLIQWTAHVVKSPY